MQRMQSVYDTVGDDLTSEKARELHHSQDAGVLESLTLHARRHCEAK